MDRIFFSVIVLCYNVEDTIIATLQSLIVQVFKEFEIIFVNDGSTDNTQLILENFDSTVLRKIINQPNKGLGAARNTGIKASQGKYIAFLDADDTWTSDKLKIIHEYLKDEIFDIICNNEYVVDSNFSLIKKNYYGPYSTYDDLLFKNNCLSPSAVVVKRNIFERVGYFTENLRLLGVEDYDLWLKIAFSGIKIKYITEFLGNYVMHKKNMSQSFDFFDKIERLLVLHFIQHRANLNYSYKFKKRLLVFYLNKTKSALSMLKFKYIIGFFYDIGPLFLPIHLHLKLLKRKLLFP